MAAKAYVSRVLNNRPNVSDEAKKRVMKVIKKYNYQPSPAARGLAKSHNFKIGILAPRRSDEALGNGFWSLLHLGIFEASIQKGYYVTMASISTDKNKKIKQYILDSKRLDAYILLTQEVTNLVIKELEKLEIPVVLIGHGQNKPNFNSIDVNNFDGAYQATKHLVKLGHKRVGVIMADPTMKESVDRIKGYETAPSETGLPVHENYLARGNYSQDHGFETINSGANRNWTSPLFYA
jgi:LacI family transcriptional regulator